jgi:hypothetical protein
MGSGPTWLPGSPDMAPSVTMRIYAHVTPCALAAASGVFGEAFGTP